MVYLISKYLFTSLVVILLSELARRIDRLGGLIAALPLVTVLTLIWLYIEQQPAEKIGNHAWYTFWYVLPTLPMFLLFPWLLDRLGFWWALLICLVFTCGFFALYAAALRKFDIELL